MGMVDVRNAFQNALGTRGSVKTATMRNSRDPVGQLLGFTFTKPDGSTALVESVIPNNTDINAAAAKMAADWIAAQDA